MTNPPRSRVRLLVIAMMLIAIGCVGVLSMPRPGKRISILHDYWAHARVDTASTQASLERARKEAPLAVPVGQYATTDKINLGDRTLKSRFELFLSDAGTFEAARITTIGRDVDDRVSIKGRYRIVGRALEFVPMEGPVGLYPVDGASLITLQDDGTLLLTAGDRSIALRMVASARTSAADSASSSTGRAAGIPAPDTREPDAASVQDFVRKPGPVAAGPVTGSGPSVTSSGTTARPPASPTGPARVDVVALNLISNDTAAGIVVECTPASADGATTTRLYRSPTPRFTPPGSGNLVATVTGSGTVSLTDPKPSIGAPNYYRAIVTDSLSHTATTTQSAGAQALASNWRQPLVIGNVGDSLTAGLYASSPSTEGYVHAMAAFLNETDPFHSYTVSNQGISGTTTHDWATGSTLSHAIDAMRAAGASWVTVMLGNNDANPTVERGPVSVETYLANMDIIVRRLVSAGFRVYVSGFPGYKTGVIAELNDAGIELALQYEAAILTLDNNSTVLVDAKNLVEKMAPYTSGTRYFHDGQHPSTAGHLILGQLKAVGIIEANQRARASTPVH